MAAGSGAAADAFLLIHVNGPMASRTLPRTDTGDPPGQALPFPPGANISGHLYRNQSRDVHQEILTVLDVYGVACTRA